jgi:hypothetical protein
VVGTVRRLPESDQGNAGVTAPNPPSRGARLSAPTSHADMNIRRVVRRVVVWRYLCIS